MVEINVKYYQLKLKGRNRNNLKQKKTMAQI